jgi:hypothetical protein
MCVDIGIGIGVEWIICLFLFNWNLGWVGQQFFGFVLELSRIENI